MKKQIRLYLMELLLNISLTVCPDNTKEKLQLSQFLKLYCEDKLN